MVRWNPATTQVRNDWQHNVISHVNKQDYLRFFSTAYCKNHRQEKWFKFDDDCVSPLDRSEVKSSAAYILFYTINDDDRWRYQRSD